MLRFCLAVFASFLAMPALTAQLEFQGIPRVIDADTLDVAGQNIRLGGIDAPEMSELCTDTKGNAWACGVWATQHARELLNGKTVRCIDLGDRSYARVVGRCYLNGRDLAVLLIEAGAARPCLRFARAQGTDQIYQQAEDRAKAARAGIYAGPLNPVAGFCKERAQRQTAGRGADPATECAIKGNVSANGRIYHMPGQRDYDRVTMRGPETRWFCSEDEARAAGWRRARR